jgi:hypothetical protein
MKLSFSLLSALMMLPVSIFAQGSLTPPGAPAPTMKTLNQVEPRTIINATNTPGNGTNQFIISAPGSYYLTGNITGVSGKNCILINTSDVTLDLNGFSITGAGLVGIKDGGSAVNITVRNGTIYAGAVGLDVSYNAGTGMKVGDRSMVRDCVANYNFGDNIVTGFNANVTHCTAVGANGYGINLQGVATDCVANLNSLYGIAAGNNSLVSRCAAAQNAGGGISVGNGSTIAGCAASGNGSGSGTGNGISTGTGCTVTDSTASNNTVAYGILANPGSTITNCTASYNTSAQSVSAGILAGGATVIGCTAGFNTNTNATASHTTGMGIYNNGSDTTIRNCTLFYNKGDGVNVGTQCMLAENLSNNNGVDGIFASNNLNRIEGNHVQSNGGIGIHAGADWVMRNSSSSNSGGNLNPTIGNDIAPIQQVKDATNPFANFP